MTSNLKRKPYSSIKKDGPKGFKVGSLTYTPIVSVEKVVEALKIGGITDPSLEEFDRNGVATQLTQIRHTISCFDLPDSTLTESKLKKFKMKVTSLRADWLTTIEGRTMCPTKPQTLFTFGKLIDDFDLEIEALQSSQSRGSRIEIAVLELAYAFQHFGGTVKANNCKDPTTDQNKVNSSFCKFVRYLTDNRLTGHQIRNTLIKHNKLRVNI